MFQQVHKDLKEGRRKMLNFDKAENNLQVDNFYLLDGMLLYLESVDLKERLRGRQNG